MNIHHLAVRVRDPLRAAAFYGRLGLKELKRLGDAEKPRAVWLLAGDTVLMLEQELRGKGAAEGSGHLLAFATTDLAESEARLRAAGIAVEDRTETTLYFRDPDGHRVALSAYRFEASQGRQ